MVSVDFYIPPEEELNVEEVNLSSPTLRAGAFHLGKHCENQNNEFMLCRSECDDPRKCLKEGRDVTNCSLDFFRLLKKNCLNEFNEYSNCLFQTSGDYSFNLCRRTQAVYDNCVLEKLNIERPDFGYYCRVRVHDTQRPKPPAGKKAVYPDATKSLPDDAPKPPAKYGSRWYFQTE